jgi:hypothetical protein
MSAGSPPRRGAPPPPKFTTVDPSLGPTDPMALKVIEFDQEFALEFRCGDNEGATRFIRFRIITTRKNVGDVQPLELVKLEILDDSDLSYFVEATFDAAKFQTTKEGTGLLVEFEYFATEVQTLLQESLKARSEITATFWEEDDGSGTLEFNQLLDLKAVEILKIVFQRSSPDFVAQQVQHRYEKLRFELNRRKLMLKKFKQEMQLRNPILYKQIDPHQKSPPRK